MGTSLDDWQMIILAAEVKAMDGLLAWLSAGNWLPEADAAMAAINYLEKPDPLKAGEISDTICRVSEMANTLYGCAGMAADRESRLRAEATPRTVAAAAYERRQRALDRMQ